jgi:cytochrome bd-type quinol oxidase subunit 2
VVEVQRWFVTNVTACLCQLPDVYKTMDTTGIIIFSIIVLHLLAGVGYILYKLNPEKKDKSVKTKI